MTESLQVNRPPEFMLKMTPDHDSRGPNQELCTVDIHVRFTESYPRTPPFIKLLNPNGISDEMLYVLNNEVIEMSKTMVGEVMIMEIAQHISSWLQIQQRQKTTYSSFYEEMQARNLRDTLQEEQKKLKEKEKQEQICKEERAAISEEVAKTQEALREMKKQHLPRKVSIGEAPKVSVALNKDKVRKRSSSATTSTSSFRSTNHEWEGIKTLTFNLKGEKIRVERLSHLSSNVYGGSVYVGYSPDLQGKLVAVSEWNFVPPKDDKRNRKVAFCDSYTRDEKTLLKQLGIIEQGILLIFPFKF